MKKRLFCLTALITLLPAVKSQGAPPPRIITYDQAIAIALEESFTSKYFEAEMTASRYAYLYTRAEFKPMLNISLAAPSWNEGVREIARADGLPVYNTTGSLQTEAEMSFTYVLPTGGNIALSSRMYWENYNTTLSEMDNQVLKRDQVYSRFALSLNQPIFTANLLRENMKVAELEYLRTTSSFTRTQMDIVYRVTSGFYGVYQLAYQHRIIEAQLANAREAYRITRLKHEAGNVPEGEILIAEITVSQNEARLMESEGTLAAAKDDFKLLIGLPLGTEIELEAEMEFEAFPVNVEQAIDQALANRMEIREDSVDIALQAINIRRAKRQRELKGNISAYYDFTGLSTEGNRNIGRLVNSAFDNMTTRPPNRGIAFTLSYPILDWGRAKNQIRRQQTHLQQMELEQQDNLQHIEREVRAIVRTVHEAERRYRINQRNREVVLESYRISQLRFANGEMTNQELSIEQERLSQVQLDYIQSYITYRLAVADLNRKTMYDFENNRSFLPDNREK